MPLYPLEKQIFLWLHGFNIPVLNQLMQGLSSFGVWLPILGWFFWLGKKQLKRQDLWRLIFITVLVLALVDTSTSYFFKNLIQRLRPCKMEELKPLMAHFGQSCGGKWGFFSSHAANASALVHLWMAFLKPSRLNYVIAWAFVALVSYSRIYLGVHLPLDIVAGILWGILIASLWRLIARASLTGPGAP